MPLGEARLGRVGFDEWLRRAQARAIRQPKDPKDLAATVLDRVIPLDDLVADGLLAMSEGRAKGKVVVDPRA